MRTACDSKIFAPGEICTLRISLGISIASARYGYSLECFATSKGRDCRTSKENIESKSVQKKILNAMYLDGRIASAMACLFVFTLGGAGGDESRKARSVNSKFDGPLQSHRANSIHTEYRAQDRRLSQRDYRIVPNYIGPVNEHDSNVISNTAIEDYSRELHEEDKFVRAIMSKDYQASSPSDLAKFDRIGERMIDRANITEEAKRVVRQVKKQRPGFFWTLFRVAFETVNETRSAIQQISNLVESNFVQETTTVGGGIGGSRASATTQQVITTGSDNSIDSNMATTTEEPYQLTVNGLQSIIRRNLRGLVRLFNIEWRDALDQSQTNVREFQRDLGNRISPFLQDNPDVV